MEPITTAAVLAAIKEDYAEKGAAYHYANGKTDELGFACYYRTPVTVRSEGDEFGEGGIRFDHSEGAAGCFVGRILDKLGVLPDKLYISADYRADEGQERERYIENVDARAAIGALGVTFENDEVIDGLLHGQRKQDEGSPLDATVIAFARNASISIDDLGFTL